MVTRREVIGGLAGILSARKMPAMLIGARTVCMTAAAGGGCKNPYITDGLVAMWDGAWNAGPGVHDGNATTWTDVVRGIVANPQKMSNAYSLSASGITVHDNRISFSNYAYVAGLDKFPGDFVPSRGSGGESTVSVVASMSSNTRNGYGGCFSIGTVNSNNRRVVGLDQRSVDSVNGRGFGGLQYRYSSWVPGAAIGNEGPKLNADTVYSMTIRLDGSYASISAFGVSGVHRSSGGTLVFDNSKDKLTLGGSLLSGATCDIYNIRFYSRALTDAELYANYAVDNARFNLQ